MSDDVKSTTLQGINKGLRTAINRLHNQLQGEMSEIERKAVQKATQRMASEIRRMREESDSRYNQAQREMDKRIKRIQRDLGAQISEQAERINARLVEIDKHHSRALKDLGDKVFDSIDNLHQELQGQIDVLGDNIALLNVGMQKLAGDIQTLETNVDQRFNQQQQQINSLAADVRDLFDLRQADRNEKILAAGRALAVLEVVRERTPLDRFAPKHMLDRLALLEQRLRNIKDNPDACTITDANNLFDEALIAENEAKRQQAKWIANQELAKTTANALLRLMQDSMNLKVNSIYDETQKEELQTDYWTHGRFRELEEEIKKIKDRIDSEKADIAELDALIKKMKEQEEQLVSLREEAVQLGVLSECRVAVSNDILNTMIAQGWEIMEDQVGYMGGDEDEDCREGTFAILRKPSTGEELSIIILPERQGDEVVNKIVFHRNDDKIEPKGAFQTRMEQIKREIEKSGHQLGALTEPPCGGDGKITQAQNAADLKRKGAAGKLSKSMNRR